MDLYYLKAAGVLWFSDDQPFRTIQANLEHSVGNHTGSYTDTDPRLEPEMFRRSLPIFATHPLGALVMTLRGLLWVAFVPDRANLALFGQVREGAAKQLHMGSSHIMDRISELLRSPWLTAIVLLQFVLMLITWAGAIASFRFIRICSLPQLGTLVLGGVLGFAMLLVVAGPEGMARYRVPVEPLLAMLAGIGLQRHPVTASMSSH